MNRRLLTTLIGLLAVVVVGAVAMFLATGEGRRDTGGRDRAESRFPPRTVEAARLDDAQVEALGWSPAGLTALADLVARLPSDHFAIWTADRIVLVVGDPAVPHDLHSMRKALLSALVGLHAGPGPRQIPLDASLAELGIDDAPGPLSDLQKQATVRDLLRSRSGINHPAAAEAGLTADKTRRLGEAENPPGTVWAYNNWDYNALTTIFERRTGLSVAEAFAEGLAAPLGMIGFAVDDVHYIAEPELSRHPAAMFRMSGADLLTFGRLYLDRGRAGGRQVLPAAWIDRIAVEASETGIGGMRAGHGDLWWLPDPAETGLPAGSYMAWGLGQQMLLVIPAWDSIVVHQADMAPFIDRWRAEVDGGADPEAALEDLVTGCFDEAARATAFCREDRFTSRREFEALVRRIVAARIAP